MKNRHGYNVSLEEIEKVENYDDGGAAITYKNGMTFGVGADELGGFEPQPGDALVLFTKNFSMVMGIIIENRVLRYKTPQQAEKDHQAMLDKFRLDKLEAYVKHGDELKARAAALPKPLADRMARFAAEKDAVEFWIDSAPYEMACLEGAAALLRKVQELEFITDVNDPTDDGGADLDGAIEWIEGWWDINSDKHDPPYDYKKQMEIVPDFGDSHSGFTASAAKGLAVAILEGQEI